MLHHRNAKKKYKYFQIVPRNTESTLFSIAAYYQLKSLLVKFVCFSFVFLVMTVIHTSVVIVC